MTQKHPDHDIVSYQDECLDISGAADIEIKIRSDGKVIWINTPFCVLRICEIKGNILVEDERKWNEKPYNPDEHMA
jgi:hypothetical protein